MVRNRSRSRSNSRDREKERERIKKERDREREREKERERNRDSKHHRKRSKEKDRSISPRHKRDKKARSRSKSPCNSYLTLGNVKPKTSISAASDKPFIVDPNQLEGKSEEEIEMLKVMGFSGFDTTKNKHVEGSANAYAVNVQEKRRYRQYMNRKGGFNRPLDPVA